MDPITLALALAQFAPSILRYFGVGEKPVAVAEKVLDIAKVVTGAQTPEAALAAMRENAHLAQQFNLAALQANVELERLCLADRASARARDVEVRKISGYNWRADLMIVCCAGALVYIVYAINTGTDVRPEVLAIFNMAVGALLKMLGDAFSFEFGSSRGSKEKDELLARK